MQREAAEEREMTSGGHARSGPLPDPTSARSDRRGYTLTALPASFDGSIPEFPLPSPTVREVELWEQKWRGPHGAAWSTPSESWRAWHVGLWVRTAVRCEASDAPAALISNLHRLSDQAGLSTAGLAEMGWKVAVDETAPKREANKAETPRRSARDRMKVVPDAAAGA